MTDKTGTASYAASAAAAGVGALTLQEWAAAIGILLAILTFAVNWHYKRREIDIKRSAEEAARKAAVAKEAYYRGPND